jgi:hypothetical protein
MVTGMHITRWHKLSRIHQCSELHTPICMLHNVWLENARVHGTLNLHHVRVVLILKRFKFKCTLHHVRVSVECMIFANFFLIHVSTVRV